MTTLLTALAEDGGGTGGTGGNPFVPSNTPLDYGNSLLLFLSAEEGITTSGDDVTAWEEPSDAPGIRIFDRSQLNNSRAPVFESSVQNGFPGVNFQQPVGDTTLNRKLSDPANLVDRHFNRTGGGTIAFAGKLNRLTDSIFDTANTILSKGYNVGTERGYDITITSEGTFRFRQRRADGSTWQISAPGFYSVGDLVLGYVSYNGGNSSNSGFARLWNGSSFVTANTVTVGTSSTIGNESADELVIGNVYDPSNTNLNAPFEGPIFAIWFTGPASSQFDENYLRRWV